MDWRYVLPKDGAKLGRVLLVGAPKGIEAELDQDELVDEVDHESCPLGTADIAVVYRANPADIDRIAAMLRPGGSLYWKISRVGLRRIRMTPGTARVILRRAGLQPIEVYWVTSGPAGPTMHLPLGGDGAVEWYFSTHRGSADPVRRFLGHIMQTVSARRGRRLERIIPTFAVTAIRPPDETSKPIELTALPAAGLPGWPVDQPVRPLMLAGGDGSWSRTVLLPFVGASREPLSVIKIARSSSFASNILAEQEILGRLGSALPADLRASLPEPLGIARIFGQLAAVESYRRGRSIRARCADSVADRAAQRADLGRAAAWLQAFHDATATLPASPDSGALDLGRVGERFARAFGAQEPEERMFRRVDAGLSGSPDQILPVVIQHRDFGPWNVLVEDDGRVSVIDWEVACEGPPLVDLAYFVAHWCWLVSGDTSTSAQIETLRRLVTGDRLTWSTAAGRAIIARAAQTLRLGPDTVAALVVWTFAEQALDRHDRLAAIGDRLAGDRASNRYVHCISALAALTDPVALIARMLHADGRSAT